MDKYDDDNSWTARIVTFVMAAPLLVYGIWCLSHGRAYSIGLSMGLTAYQGVAADFVAWSDISLATMALSSLIPFKNKKLQYIMYSILFLLFLVLAVLGMFYSPVSG